MSSTMSAQPLFTQIHLTVAEPVDAHHQLNLPCSQTDDCKGSSTQFAFLPAAAGTAVGVALSVAAVLLGGGSGGPSVIMVPFVLAAATFLIVGIGTIAGRLSIDRTASFWCYAALLPPLMLALTFSLATHGDLAAYEEQEPVERLSAYVGLFAFGMVTGTMPRPLGWKVTVVACLAGGIVAAFTVLTVRLEEPIGFLCTLALHRTVPLLLGLTIMHYDDRLRAAKRHNGDLEAARCMSLVSSSWTSVPRAFAAVPPPASPPLPPQSQQPAPSSFSPGMGDACVGPGRLRRGANQAGSSVQHAAPAFEVQPNNLESVGAQEPTSATLAGGAVPPGEPPEEYVQHYHRASERPFTPRYLGPRWGATPLEQAQSLSDGSTGIVRPDDAEHPLTQAPPPLSPPPSLPPSAPPSPPPSPPSGPVSAAFPPHVSEPLLPSEQSDGATHIASPAVSLTVRSTQVHLTAAEQVDAHLQLEPPSQTDDRKASSMLITLPLAAGTVGAALIAVILGGGSEEPSVTQVPFVLLAAVCLFLTIGTASRRLSIDAIASFWGYASPALPVTIALTFSQATRDNLAAAKEQEPIAWPYLHSAW